jgi:glycosyltransferase involved in cell wall biosynthesis
MKISVCLATYNGEKYIKEQLDSILSQLGNDDEIIISDDNSTDDTINIIRSLNDERIKIYVNKTKGIVKNFENALNNASGDIIFLSDQDDVWKNDKVKKILSAFSSDNSLTLVFSNAEIIDENGISKNYNFFKDNEANYTSIFKAFFKNQFLGCTIAFKSELKSKILPFPYGIPMHDWWIGVLSLFYGKVKFLNESLISYRRHNNNVTSEFSSNLLSIINWRITLLWLFFKRLIKITIFKKRK